MFKRFTALLVILIFLFATPARFTAAARTPTPQVVSEVVLVLPFENKGYQREFNWVGESFADSMTELLSAHGLTSVTGDAREIAYQRLRVPLTVIPSLATSIKLAREAGASLVVLGTYEVSPPQDDKSVAEVRGSARVIRVNEGRLAGKTMSDGRWATHEFFYGDALVNLQSVQGKLAYQILYEQDEKLPFSQRAIVEQATKVPVKAFESLVKGTVTDNPDKKSAYLQNAMREYARAVPGSVYTQAAFELGHLYYSQRDYKRAAENFSMLQKRDSHYSEAAFYTALSYWRSDDLKSALDAILPLTTEMPLTSIYNNAGALAVQSARTEKDAARRDALLKQATSYLSRAAESTSDVATDGLMARYNYAYALMLSGKYTEAAEQLRALLKNSPRDGEALFLFAKTLEKVGQTEEATANDNDSRRYLPAYAKAQVEWQKSQTTSQIPLRLREDFNRIEVISLQQDALDRTNAALTGSNAQNLLAKATDLYTAGRDDEALTELRDVIRVEPMNAEAYLLTGRIYQRRGELVSSINQLKTSIFWDAKLIDAHIMLGRIFLERGDRTQAMAYARNAIQIDPNNQDAIALQRQLQVGIK